MEKRELDEKLEKLHMFCYGGGPIFAGLEPADKKLMESQYTAMLSYSEILGKRIARFEVAA